MYCTVCIHSIGYFPEYSTEKVLMFHATGYYFMKSSSMFIKWQTPQMPRGYARMHLSQGSVAEEPEEVLGMEVGFDEIDILPSIVIYWQDSREVDDEIKPETAIESWADSYLKSISR